MMRVMRAICVRQRRVCPLSLVSFASGWHCDWSCGGDDLGRGRDPALSLAHVIDCDLVHAHDCAIASDAKSGGSRGRRRERNGAENENESESGDGWIDHARARLPDARSSRALDPDPDPVLDRGPIVLRARGFDCDCGPHDAPGARARDWRSDEQTAVQQQRQQRQRMERVQWSRLQSRQPQPSCALPLVAGIDRAVPRASQSRPPCRVPS